MQLYLVETGNFKLDGGAMFGVVPKTIWQRTNPSDNENRIDLAARCLLIEWGSRLLLVDAGLGDKQSEKFFAHYHRWGPYSLEGSLRAHGFSCDDITDVFFTHLHFDHVGGSVKRNSNKDTYELTFKNARYWSNSAHWQWATHPNAREKASFLKENILPIQESGQLYFTEEHPELVAELPFEILYVDGHTEKQMLPPGALQGPHIGLCGRPHRHRWPRASALYNGIRHAAAYNHDRKGFLFGSGSCRQLPLAFRARRLQPTRFCARY